MAKKNIKAIPTIYKNIHFRSRLESNFAYFLDKFDIEWVYEKQSFLIDGTHYLPDFYLPKLNLWVETKGVITKNHKLLLKKLCKITNKEGLIVSAKKSYFYEDGKLFFNLDDYVELDCIALFSCIECGNYFFSSLSGYYGCRECGAWDGDHHLGSVIEFENIDFSNILKIKELR